MISQYRFMLVCLLLVIVQGVRILLGASITLWRHFSHQVPLEPKKKRRLLCEALAGSLFLVVAFLWFGQMHPCLYIERTPFFDPSVHKWHPLKGDGTPEEAAILERLDKVTRGRFGSQYDYPPVGMCIGAVVNQRRFVFSAGTVKITSDRRPDPDTVFEIGSVTKVFTGQALARCVEEATVSLDQPVASLLPEWTVPEESHVITLKDLATHHSGLPPDGLPIAGRLPDILTMKALANPYHGLTTEDARQYLARCRPSTQAYRYSNFGVGLLGYALARHRNMTYNEMITTYICEPLGMKDTCVQVSQQADRAAQGYIVPLRICGLSLVLRPDAWTMADVYQGAVGLRSTVNDLLKYVQAHLQAPNGPLGAQLARVQTPLAETDRSDYKMGMCLMIRQVGWMESPLYWHSGTTGGFSACIAFSKKQQTGVVALANGTLKDGLVEDLLKALVISNNR